MKVELRSQAYGSEFYEYETLDEGLAGATRLARSCTVWYAKDGLERAVIIHIDAHSDDEDWEPTV